MKWICRGYIAFAFRGLDRDVLSDAEQHAIEPDKDMLSDISKPLAHIADRSKLGKTYGRVLIDSTDGIAAFIQLAMWMNRVNRIAKMHRPNTGKGHSHGNAGSAGTDVSGEAPQVSESGITDTGTESGVNDGIVLRPQFTARGFGYN